MSVKEAYTLEHSFKYIQDIDKVMFQINSDTAYSISSLGSLNSADAVNFKEKDSKRNEIQGFVQEQGTNQNQGYIQEQEPLTNQNQGYILEQEPLTNQNQGYIQEQEPLTNQNQGYNQEQNL